MVDADFLQIVDPLRDPGYGTELMGPYLYSLVRSTRARTVVEVGSGYTTPFMLKALADNAADFEADVTRFRKKTDRLAAAIAGGGSTPATDDPERERAYQRWLLDEPVWADPCFYARAYAPRLYAFDNYSQEGPAPRVGAIAATLGVSHLLRFTNVDPIGHSAVVEEQYRPVDLMFNDAENYRAFANEYWQLLNPGGGLMVFHNTLGVSAIQDDLMDAASRWQADHPGVLELLTIDEPHKLYQGSFTMLRRISGIRPGGFTGHRDDVIDEAIAAARGAGS